MPKSSPKRVAKPIEFTPKLRPQPGIPYADVGVEPIKLISELDPSMDRPLYARIIDVTLINKRRESDSYSMVTLCVEGRTHVRFNHHGFFPEFRDHLQDVNHLAQSVGGDFTSSDCSCIVYTHRVPEWLQQRLLAKQTTLIGGAPRNPARASPQRRK